jgi:3-dehydrosphinganine reductase
MTLHSRLRRAFDGTATLIPGGSKGIGLALAEHVVALGGSVCVIARGVEGLGEAKGRLEARRVGEGQRILTIACDTSDEDALREPLRGAVAELGRVDYLLNCVGFARPAYYHELTLADYRHHMEINYFGQLIPIRLVVPHMLEAGRGHIVTVSSVLGFMGIMGYAAYCPSKFALVGLTSALRSELEPKGLRFSVVYPPDVDTPGFAEENLHKPVECREMSRRGGLLGAETAAAEILRGLVRGRFEIPLGEARFVHRMVRWFPELVHRIVARDYANIRLLRPCPEDARQRGT